MKRILAVLGALIALGTLVCGVGVALNWRTLSVGIEAVTLILEDPEWAEIAEPDDLVRYIGAHPDAVSLAVCNTADDGVAHCEMTHRADVPRPLASTVKIAVLVAYADAVDAGVVHPDDPVSFADWERWYLPGTDGGAHPSAVDSLGLTDPTTLDQVVEAMVTHSDNAATDLVLERIGLDRVDATLARLGIEMDPLHPLLGEFLLFDDPGVSREGDLRAAALQAVADFESQGRPAPDLGGLSAQKAGTERVDHRASAETFAALLAATFGPELSADARARIHHHLEWPMRKNGASEAIEVLGTKGGALPGVLTEAMYVVPKAGPHAGRTRIIVLFMEDMPMAAWFAELSSFSHQRLMARMAADDAWVRRLDVALAGASPDVVHTATPGADAGAAGEGTEAEPAAE